MAALSSFVPMAPALHSFGSAILYFVEIAGYYCTEYSVCAFSCMMDADNILLEIMSHKPAIIQEHTIAPLHMIQPTSVIQFVLHVCT